MDKIATYQLILEDHPLWQKEAEDIDLKKPSRERAALQSALGGILSRTANRRIPLAGVGTASAAAGAQEDRRGRAAAGHIGGRLLGNMVGLAIGKGNRTSATDLADVTGGALGTYLAHGKNRAPEELRSIPAEEKRRRRLRTAALIGGSTLGMGLLRRGALRAADSVLEPHRTATAARLLGDSPVFKHPTS